MDKDENKMVGRSAEDKYKQLKLRLQRDKLKALDGRVLKIKIKNEERKTRAKERAAMKRVTDRERAVMTQRANKKEMKKGEDDTNVRTEVSKTLSDDKSNDDTSVKGKGRQTKTKESSELKAVRSSDTKQNNKGEKKKKTKNETGSILSKKALEEKRRKEREKKRRYREKIKQNPEALAKKRKMDREVYARRKEKGNITSISKKSKREQRLVRKRWVQNSRNYRKRLAMATQAENLMEANTPPSSPSLHEEDIVPVPIIAPKASGNTSTDNSFRRVQKVKTKNKVSRSSLVNKLRETELELRRVTAKMERYKKRLQRNKKTNVSTPSPRSKVKIITAGQKVSPFVRKRLLFGEALFAQLKENRKKCATDTKAHQLLSKFIGGGVLKKHRVIGEAKGLASYRVLHKYQANNKFEYERKRKSNSLSPNISLSVQHFLEEDCNSRMCPGKKDFKTKNREKVQKRLLLDSMKNLHRKYMESHNNRLSYASFCRLKPFWIMEPRASDRETCGCRKHLNVQMIIDKLYQHKIVSVKKAEELGNILCCDARNKKCMYGICLTCKTKIVPTAEGMTDEQKNSIVSYHQWTTKTEQRTARGKQITVKLSAKTAMSSTVLELLENLNHLLPQFLVHVFNIQHQYYEMKTLKDNLKPNELVLHMDFAENYVLKYNTEIQAMHFGASKQQITLHTGVMYFSASDKLNNTATIADDKTKCMPFCTVSSTLDHAAYSVWAHLKPILKMIETEFPGVDTLHIQTDGPSAQYRNRSNFFLLVNFLPQVFRQICNTTWNFSESGHGKGPMDGVGGLLKRTADKLVAQGKDIPTVTDFMKHLQDACPGIRLFEIPTAGIEDMKNYCLQQNIPSVPYVMKIHQITWSATKPLTLTLRELSCFQCSYDTVCSHHSLGAGKISFPDLQTSCNDDVLDTNADTPKVKQGEWIAVLYNDQWYPGLVEEIKGLELSVTFMARVGKKNFKWPEVADKQKVNAKNILCKIPHPPIPISSRYFAFQDFDKIENLV